MSDSCVAPRWTICLAGLLGGLLAAAAGMGEAWRSEQGVADEPATRSRVDPAAWGDDHVGQGFPEYVTGDECLFCHRDIGPNWTTNRHQLTVRPANPADPALATLSSLPAGVQAATETTNLLGSEHTTRFLKRSGEYGHFDLLTTAFVPQRNAEGMKVEPVSGVLRASDSLAWDTTNFADRCAGCHTTAVQTAARAFSAISLDCFACHGDVRLEHSTNPGLVLLSRASREPRQVISLCGQCHLRGGKSHSTGLPYPNTFVAGDNLFRDYRVDFSDEAIRRQPAVDQHIFLNARDVAVLGRNEMTCLTCHRVHAQSAELHQGLDSHELCASCHVPASEKAQLVDAWRPPNRWRTHHGTCDY